MRKLRAASSTVAIFLAAVSVLVGMPFVARAATVEMRQDGRIASSMLPYRRHLQIDATARRLFEIGQRADAPGMRIDAHDLDTLRSAGSVTVPDAQSGIGGMLSAVDELHHRLYVLYPLRQVDDAALRNTLGESNANGTIDEAARVFFGVAVVDTLALRLIGSGVLTLLQPVSPQDRSESNAIGVKALTFYRDGDRDLLYLATEVPAGFGNAVAGLQTVAVHQVDVERLLDGTATRNAVDWSYPLPQCPLVMARDLPGVLYRSPTTNTLSLPCRQGGAQGLVAGQPGSTPGIVQVRLGVDPTKFSTAFYAVSGNLQYGVATVDPLSERLFLQIDGSASEAGVWVFDVPTASFIGLTVLPGQFAQGGTLSLAVDVARARLYALSRADPETLHTTFVSSATDAEQVDQGSLQHINLRPIPIKRRAVVDPVLHRLFIPADPGIVVIADPIPSRTRTPSADPDASTRNVAEGVGTNANYVGGAQAFGARLRFVGGIRGLERNANTTVDQLPSEASPQTGGITPPPASEGTRDVHFARVLHSTLTNGESSARATGAERDLDNTDADASGLTTYVRRWGGPDLSDQRWPYPTVDCTDFGGSTDVRDRKALGAQTTCRLGERRTSALAVDESLSQGTVVRFARSSARTAVARDRGRGVVAIAESEVLGVDLGGVAGIGRISARAETWATGRPRAANGIGAGSSFTRSFEDVWVIANGERRTVCAAQCDPKIVRDAINAALGLRARVEIPQPEPIRAAGTPGGFESLIVRDRLERANESSVNAESDDRRLEVPAMVITVFADGRVPSRAVVSLAGVATESHYGIFLVEQATSFRPRRPRGGSTVAGGNGGNDPDAIGGIDPSGGNAGGGNPVTRAMRRAFTGFAFALSSPGRAARTMGMLMLLVGPIMLLARRRRVGDNA